MILLIRHGETALNAARVVQPEDTPLNARGEQQAVRLAARVLELGVARVLSSDLLRARMTAEALVQATGVSVEHSVLLRERDFGEIRGKAYAEIGQDIFKRDYLPKGGESWPQFEERARIAWQRVQDLAGASSGNLAVVTHGLMCAAIAAQFLCLGEGQRLPERWGNTSLTICDPAPPHAVRVLNCVRHLKDGDDDKSAPSGI
jgi:broad specificity phosphatase PhoE